MKASISKNKQKSISLAVLVWLLALIFCFLGVRFLYDMLLYAPINTDAGCYLPISRRLAQGVLPVVELNTGYTPLAFYLLSIPFLIQEYPPYIAFSFFYVTLHVFNALLIYCNLRKLGQPINLCFLGAMIQIASLSLYEGSYIFLEPFVVFFGLLSLLVYLNSSKNLALVGCAGFFALLSFLSKQYGLAVFAGLTLALLSDYQDSINLRLKKLLILFTSFAIPLLALVVYFYFWKAVAAKDTIAIFYPHGYIQDVPSIQHSLALYLPNFLFILLTPILFIRAYPLRQKALTVFLILIFMSMTLLIRSYLHYFQLLIPFSIILGMLSFAKLLNNNKLLGSISLFSLFPLIINIYVHPLWQQSHPTERKMLDQGTNREAIHAFWKTDERVLIFSDPSMYHILTYLPVNDLAQGYGFLSTFSAEQIVSFMKEGKHILIDRQSNDYYLTERNKIEQKYGDFNKLLSSLGYSSIAVVNERFELWQRST